MARHAAFSIESFGVDCGILLPQHYSIFHRRCPLGCGCAVGDVVASRCAMLLEMTRLWKWPLIVHMQYGLREAIASRGFGISEVSLYRSMCAIVIGFSWDMGACHVRRQ